MNNYVRTIIQEVPYPEYDYSPVAYESQASGDDYVVVSSLDESDMPVSSSGGGWLLLLLGVILIIFLIIMRKKLSTPTYDNLTNKKQDNVRSEGKDKLIVNNKKKSFYITDEGTIIRQQKNNTNVASLNEVIDSKRIKDLNKLQAMPQTVKIISAEESDMQNEKNKQSLINGVSVPFVEINELLDTDWCLGTIKLVASFYNKRYAEGNFVYTGNLDNDDEIEYFDMVRRILEAFVVAHKEEAAFPSSVLMRILSNSENKCFLECILSYTPEDFDRLNQGEVFLPDVFKAIMETAEKRYTTLA